LQQLEQSIAELKQQLTDHRQVIATKDQVIESKNQVLEQREQQVQQLEDEVKRLQQMVLQSGSESSELGKLLTQTQKQLFDAEERINRLLKDQADLQARIQQLQSECS
jgi:chromosome segregation ATPase